MDWPTAGHFARLEGRCCRRHGRGPLLLQKVERHRGGGRRRGRQIARGHEGILCRNCEPSADRCYQCKNTSRYLNDQCLIHKGYFDLKSITVATSFSRVPVTVLMYGFECRVTYHLISCSQTQHSVTLSVWFFLEYMLPKNTRRLQTPLCAPLLQPPAVSEDEGGAPLRVTTEYRELAR